MYKVDRNYIENIYKSNHELKLYIDNVLIEDKYIFEFDKDFDLFADDKLELGSTPMQEVTLKLHKNALPVTHSKLYVETGILNGKIIPEGHYNIKDIEEDGDIFILTCYDNMEKFDFLYDMSKTSKEMTEKEILQDLCRIAGITFKETNLINGNILISIYDNSIKAREYLSYIAECEGGIAFINKDGELEIKTLEQTSYSYTETNITEDVINSSFNGSAIVKTEVGNSLYIEYEEKIEDLEVLFREVYFDLSTNGELTVNIPEQLKGRLSFKLQDDILIATVEDVYTDKIVFVLNENGELIVNYDKDIILLYRDIVEIEEEYTEINLKKGYQKLYILDNIGNKVNFDVEYKQYAEININLFQDFDFNKEPFICSRIYYENGVEQFARGNENNKTIYLDANNLYIVDEEQINNIYLKLKDLKLYGFTGSSIIDPALDIGDVVYIDDKPVIYQGKYSYLGRFKADINSNISAVKENENVTKISTATKVRRIQSRIDEEAGKIDLLAEEVEGNNTKIANFQIGLNGIVQLVSEKVGKNQVIASLNLEIKDGKGIVNLEGNVVTIKSDKTVLDQFGKLTTSEIIATGGQIAGLSMSHQSNGSFLYKTYASNNSKYQSGFYIPDSGSGDNIFLYAGCPQGESLLKSNLYICHNGLMRAKWFDVNGENGYFKINYDSGRMSQWLNSTGIRWYVDDKENNFFGGLIRSNYNIQLDLSSAYSFDMVDTLHNQVFASFMRYNPGVGDSFTDKGACIAFGADVQIAGEDMAGKRHKLQVGGDIDAFGNINQNGLPVIISNSSNDTRVSQMWFGNNNQLYFKVPGFGTYAITVDRKI